jgi:hypothetical protein
MWRKLLLTGASLLALMVLVLAGIVVSIRFDPAFSDSPTMR